jgi:hypothetical protein
VVARLVGLVLPSLWQARDIREFLYGVFTLALVACICLVVLVSVGFFSDADEYCVQFYNGPLAGETATIDGKRISRSRWAIRRALRAMPIVTAPDGRYVLSAESRRYEWVPLDERSRP